MFWVLPGAACVPVPLLGAWACLLAIFGSAGRAPANPAASFPNHELPIDASGEPAARAKRDSARLIHREAAASLRAGDTAATARLLDQATREMMDGARLARPEQVAGEKTRRDFNARLDSARALLAAQQRITQEKGAAPEATDATRRIEAQIAQAQQLAAAGRLDEARPVIDRAYLTARVSIEAMRRGDTLVRSLNFASPREEYDYELDRNDTHRMLIDVVLADWWQEFSIANDSVRQDLVDAVR